MVECVKAECLITQKCFLAYAFQVHFHDSTEEEESEDEVYNYTCLPQQLWLLVDSRCILMKHSSVLKQHAYISS